MIDMEEILPLVLAVFVAVVLFFGFVTAVKKTMKTSPPQGVTEHELMLKDQKQLMEDIRRRQKDLIRDQKQKIRDAQRF